MKNTFLWLVILFATSCQDEPIGLPSPIDDKIFFTGLDCTGSGEYSFNPDNLLEDLIISDSLPESYDLSNLLPPVGNQGQQGSCTSWAVSYYMKSLQENLKTELQDTSSVIMSPSFTYNQITQGNCEGTGISETLDFIKEKGVCSIQEFPYSDGSCSIQPADSVMKLAENAKISDYKNLSGNNMVLEMKTLITEQTPIIIGAYLSAEFGKLDEFDVIAYRDHKVDYSSNRCHAMLVVGYSDTYNAFKVVNSWGSDWGNDGFIWIDYKAFENVLDENAEFKVINQAYIAYDLK